MKLLAYNITYTDSCTAFDFSGRVANISEYNTNQSVKDTWSFFDFAGARVQGPSQLEIDYPISDDPTKLVDAYDEVYAFVKQAIRDKTCLEVDNFSIRTLKNIKGC